MDLVSIVKDGFDAYQQLQQRSPLLGSVITSEVSFVAADIISQYALNRKINPKKIAYTAACAPMFGAMIYGLIESGNIVGKYISANPLIMAALGPNLFGNLMNAHFYANNTIGERNQFSLSGATKEYLTLFDNGNSLKERTKNAYTKYFGAIPKKEYLNATIGTLTAWNVIQAINYSYISDEMRTPFSLSIGFLWTTTLTMWSIKGNRKHC